MSFDQESKSEENKIVLGCVCGGPTKRKKNNRYLLIFCAHALYKISSSWFTRGWSGGAKVLGKLPVPGRSTILITVGQGPTALAVGAGGGCLDIFALIYPFSSLSPSLWETARYRLKYCLKGPLNPKQPTNQHPGSRPSLVLIQKRGSRQVRGITLPMFYVNQ